MFSNKIERIIFFAALVLALVTYFAGLSIDVARDAGKYATISKEILANKDWIHLTVHGEDYDQKPHMLFWLGAGGFSIGGVSSFWFKLPILLLVFAGFYWAFKLGESLYNRRVGLIAAVLLFFSFVFSMYTMDVHTDTPLQAFVVLALWQLYEFVKFRKNKNCLFGFIAVGLAMLTKGPVGAVIPAFAVVGHLLLKKDFRFLFDIRWFVGIVIAFVVASPAVIALWNQFGWSGLWFFFWENNVGRVVGTYTNTFSDPFFYVHSLMYLFLPWCLIFYASVFFEFKALFKNRFVAAEYISFAGIWIFFIILNVSRSQLPNYVFSLVPLMAIVTAKWIDRALSQNDALLRLFNGIQIVVVSSLWILYFGISNYALPAKNGMYMVLAATGLLLTLYVYIKSRDKLARLLLPSILSITCLLFLLNTHAYPIMFSLQAPPKAAKYYSDNRAGIEKLYNYNYSQYELFFFSQPQAINIGEDQNVKDIVDEGACWVFTDRVGFEELLKIQSEPVQIINYDHYSMKHAARYLNPFTRESLKEKMYLLKYE